VKITAVKAWWLHVPIEAQHQHTSDFGRHSSFDTALVRVETDAGRLRRFDVGEGYLGAVAATGPITSVRPIRPGEDLWTI